MVVRAPASQSVPLPFSAVGRAHRQEADMPVRIRGAHAAPAPSTPLRVVTTLAPARIATAMVGALILSACAPSVPDSGAGVGFQDYNSYIRSYPAPGAAPRAPATGFDPAAASAAIDRAEGLGGAAAPGLAAPSGERPRGGAPAGIREESGELVHSHTAISDENDFGAVSARETIESDRERIERNRAEYVVVQPEALPQRPGNAGPNIVAYALATAHPPGTQMYSRSRLFARDPAVACGKYTSSDLAQEAFLARGGPDKDPLGLDPDGDGYACSWDPRPFRTALK